MSAGVRYGALGLLLLLGVVVRLAFLLHWPRRLNVDEATTGLMALRILRGELPIFFYGQGYLGAPESYLTVVVYALAGASPLALKVAPFLFSCLFIVITFLLGRRMAGWLGGLSSALLVAVAPPFLPLYGNFPMLGYMEVVVIGSVVLLLTLDLVTSETGGAKRSRRLWILGLVTGVGWWIHPMVLSYLAAAGVFLLFHPALWSTRGLWAVPVFFLLGSLPFWIFNLTHAFGSFALVRKGAEGNVIANLQTAGSLLLEIAGIKGVAIRGVVADPVPFFSPAAGIVYLALLGLLVMELPGWRASQEPEARRRRRGIQLLLVFALFHFIAFSLNRQAELRVQRYLFPLYSALPTLTGIALLRLWRWSRVLATGALVLLLLNNGVGLWKTYQAFEVRRQNDWWKPDPVVEFLEAQGLTRAYADGRIALRLTVETQERIIATDPFLQWYPFLQRYPPHLQWVDASPRVAYILSRRFELTPTRFESSLQGIGATYERKDFGDFSVFYDFRPPSDGTLVSLPPNGWRAEGNPSGSDPTRAFDRDADTAWLSEEFLKPGMWYRLDLGRTHPVGGITLLPARPKIGLPQGYRIELSPDGTTWETVASVPEFIVTLRWRDSQPRMDRRGHVVNRFAARPVRYVRITQTGENPSEWWAIAEVFVYGLSPTPVVEHQEASAHLRDGLRLEQDWQWAAALAAYERAVRLDPELEEAHRRIIEVYHRAQLPLEGTDLYNRGLVFEQLGMWARAAREYETLLAQDSEHGEHSALLSRLLAIYRRQGQGHHAERIERTLREQYAPPIPAEARFGHAARLLGYGLEPREPRTGDEVELAYYWQALKPMTEDYAVFVHFVQDGRIRFTQDHEPLHGRYPTSRWREGELVRERYRVRLPPELPPGEYELRIGLWQPNTGKRLSVDTSLPHLGDRVRLTTLRIPSHQ